jgi:hypothetical protein
MLDVYNLECVCRWVGYRTLLKIFKKEKDLDITLNSGNMVSTSKVARDPKRLRILKKKEFKPNKYLLKIP